MRLFKWSAIVTQNFCLLLIVVVLLSSCSMSKDSYYPGVDGKIIGILDLEGSVTDEKGNPLEGIEISVSNARSIEFTIKSDDDGEFEAVREILAMSLLTFIATDIDGNANGLYASDTISKYVLYTKDDDYEGYAGITEVEIKFVMKKLADDPATEEDNEEIDD